MIYISRLFYQEGRDDEDEKQIFRFPEKGQRSKPRKKTKDQTREVKKRCFPMGSSTFVCFVFQKTQKHGNTKHQKMSPTTP